MRRTILLPILLLFAIAGAAPAEDPAARVLENPWIVMRAFLVSYPDKISGLDYDDKLRDWFLIVGENRLYWAGGRFLPADQTADLSRWRAYVDYLYPAQIPDPETFTPETISLIEAESHAETRNNLPVYNIALYDAIYDGGSRRRIESHINRIDFLGRRVSVHEEVIPALRRVETRLYRLAVKEQKVREFIASITSIEGYNWREIADSPSRSNHSWGFAVDILPKNWGKKNIYWNWVSYWNDRWMLIPLTRRWMPPEPVVAAFEAEGFIWGGKWLLWDNMHFEYRPELLALRKWGYRGDFSK